MILYSALMTITHNVQYDAAVVAAAVGYLNCHHRQQLTSIILRQLDTSRICSIPELDQPQSELAETISCLQPL